MDQNTKNRLVGVIVVFALAVIFLPMILDGSGVRKETVEVVIPAQPEVDADPGFEPKMVELRARSEALPALEPRYVDEKTPVPASAKTPPQESRPETEGAAPPAPAVQAEAAPDATATAALPSTGGDSWVLQVGSFQDRSKALAQRDRLRQSNIAAVFIEQFTFDGKPSYRVRLGPFLNRDQTRVAQNKVKAKYDIDGIIMKYER